MTEDVDKDLEGLAGDLEDLDLGELSGGDEAAADAGGDPGGESIELDDDLAAMLEDSGEDAGGGDAGLDDAGSEDAGGDDSMADASADAGGDDDISVDDMLGELAGGDADAGGDAPAPAAAAAPAPAAPRAPPLPSLSGDQAVNLEFLLDIKLHVTFEVGRSKMLISDLLTLGQGSVIELHRLVGDELDFLVNGKLVAKGEVVVVNEKFGCKINEIIPPEDRIKHLGTI